MATRKKAVVRRRKPVGSSRATREPDVQLNLNVRGLEPSATVAINEKSDRLRARGKCVYKLGLGQSPFPVPRAVVEELIANAHQKDYLPVKGLRQLREAVAEYHRRADEIGCTADDVIVGPGSKELMFLLQLVYYGDLVVPTPAWVSYAPQARIIGRQISWLPTESRNGWRLTPAQLFDLCKSDPDRPRILILNYPSNPTGGTYDEDELRELARVARRYRVVMLSDEIYGQLHHHGRHVSIARFYPEGTIVSGGLSKWCGAGGWRLGTFVFPRAMRWLLDAMAAVASETYTSTSAPIQYAAVRAFRGGLRLERYLNHSRKVLRGLGQACVERLRRRGIEVLDPMGAFYLFPDLTPLADELAKRGIRTSDQLCDRLLEETGVAILPGSNFGRRPEELTVRLALVDFDGARALAAAEQLRPEEEVDEAFVQAHCHPVLRAVELFRDWV